MSDMDPKGLWDELVRTLREWMADADDDEEQARDPTLAFHIMVTAPLVIGTLVMAGR